NVSKTIMPEEKYRTICGNIIRVSSILAFILTVAAIFLIIGFIMQITDPADLLALMRTGFLIYYTGLSVVILLYLLSIFGELKQSDTPFVYGVTKKMKALSGILVSGGALGNVFPLLGLFLHIEGSEGFMIAYAFSGFLMIVGAAFGAFTFVFGHGCKLQQESDETL
ncbi:MAG: hypothetical protein J6X60_09935, partial [Ruminiclostridium sp.]|nr:hypothetical protein [Ruminiclostridium sp.]